MSACPADISPWVHRFATLVPNGTPVLDVACGGGRHLRRFRALGHPVVGVDRDLSGVADLADTPAVTLIRADLEGGAGWPLPLGEPPFGQQFGGVVVTNYLYRPLFPVLAAVLAPGGVLIYETFALGNGRFGRPVNPDFLLQPNELLTVATESHLHVVAFEQGTVAQPRPAVVQRLCAIRPHSPTAASDGGDDLLTFRLDTIAVKGDGGGA